MTKRKPLKVRVVGECKDDFKAGKGKFAYGVMPHTCGVGPHGDEPCSACYSEVPDER